MQFSTAQLALICALGAGGLPQPAGAQSLHYNPFGLITGTAGVDGRGGSGGDGITGTNFDFTNDVSVTGGNGGAGGSGVNGGSGGNGGNGVSGSGFTLNNTASITGGGGGPAARGGSGGAGGAGVTGSNFILNNTGTVAGGTGYSATPDTAPGAGGVGVEEDGGASVINAGAIYGGGNGNVSPTSEGDAIDLSNGGNKLTLKAGYSFTSNVVSRSGTTNGGDTLILGGSTDGTFDLSQLVTTAPTSSTGIALFYGFNAYQKTGSSTWTLGGDGSGNWTIADGTLQVGDANSSDTTLTGNVAVDNGAKLEGYGSIVGNVTNDGTVTPGNGAGTLTIEGNFTQNSAGALAVNITSTGTPSLGDGQLLVDGNANLAGSLDVTGSTGTYTVGTPYRFLTATGTVSGSFSTIRYNAALAKYLAPSVSYSANAATLKLTPSPPSAISGSGETGPTISTSSNLSSDPAFATGRFYVVSMFAQTSAVRSVLTAPWAYDTSTVAENGYWLRGVGSFGQANGGNFNTKGFVIGKGFKPTPDLVIGAAVSNVYDSAMGGGSSVDGTSFGAVAYSIYTQGRLTIAGSAGFGHLGDRISRGLPTLGERAQTNSNGSYQGVAVNAQFDLINIGNIFLAPYASADYLHTDLGSGMETGAGILNLRYEPIATSLGQISAGLRGGIVLPVSVGTLIAWASLGGISTVGNTHANNVETLGLFHGAESALVAPQGAVTPSAGVLLAEHGLWSLAAAWSGQYGDASSEENFTLQAKYAF